MYKLISLLLVGFMLLGCVSRYRWSKEGSDKNEFNRDNYQCQIEAASIYPGPFTDHNTYLNNQEMIQKASDLCLKARGWDRVRVK